jgi:hypothetical protein
MIMMIALAESERRFDILPKLPTGPLYERRLGAFDVNSI